MTVSDSLLKDTPKLDCSSLRWMKVIKMVWYPDTLIGWQIQRMGQPAYARVKRSVSRNRYQYGHQQPAKQLAFNL